MGATAVQRRSDWLGELSGAVVFEPINEFVLVVPDPEEHMRESGIVVPSAGAPHVPRWGTVVKVGPGRLILEGVRAGQHLEPAVRAGDRVLCLNLAGYEVELAGERLRVVRDLDILGLVRS